MNIESILRKHKKSVTQERIDIFYYIKSNHMFCANDIILQFSEIWRASIFRTIKLFLEIWIIRRLYLSDKEEVYELNKSSNHHEHMKCEKCWDIINYESEKICKKIFNEAKKIWFNIREHNIWVIWTCKKCI